jgi:NADP-dependent 3-hydroxy acid dehydrogenase YdfG
MRLEDQVAIVTGASSGIGEGIARALAERGLRLVLNGRRADRLERLSAELDRSVAVAGDIRDPATPQRLIDRAVDSFGRLDVAINNAGMLEVGTVEAIDLDRVAAMVRLNVEAAFRFAYTMLRHFKAQDRGHLINTSSILGTTVRPTTGAYAGTKYAIEALTHALRIELARTSVRLTNVQPGLVLTELHRHMARHPKDALGIEQPLTPQDIARAVLFALEQPAHVQINSIQIVPCGQEL